MSSIFLLSLKKTQTMGFPKIHLLLFTIFTFLSLPKFLSQLVPPLPVLVPAPAPAPAADICNGVFLSYIYISGKRLPPLNSTNQAYKFKSIATILNNGVDEFKGWRLFVGFQHDEILVSATSVVLADGTNLPAPVGNGTVFAGFPSSDLQTAIDTAGDLTQMEVQIKLVGTQFGVKPPSIPMPSNISLLNDGYICPQPTMQGKNVMQVCCVKDPDFTATTTEVEFLPRQNGDLTIDYDVIKTFDANYFAEVKMSMHNSLGRLDHWKLTWDWMRDEFILGMKGAYPSIVDSTDCIYGPQGAHYTNLDFSTVLNCQKRPTIIDLPATVANDPNLGMIPFCCRNGTILPEEMNPSWSSSAFQIQVQKMPPDLNRTELFPPQNWKISGSSLNPNYKCGPPIRVSASQYPGPNGLLSVNTTAVASWQVVCNITQPTGASPKCCVSFSAFYNDSVIPCETCACGCPKNPSQTCSATSQAMILPPDALLVPFVNRTAKAVAWASLKHRPIPSPLPCPDNCGVSINWHLNSDFTKGWTARVTLFNWAETVYPDWFTAMEFKKAVPGFEAMYSFNGTILNTTANNTIFMTGLPGLNYLMPILPANATLKNPPIPGKQQSVISFTKKLTPGIDIIGGDGFPTKVFFNGEECSLPSIIPMNNGHRFDSSFSGIWVFVISVITLRLIQQ